ncbi:MAG: histidine phosphatase family protein [Clostridiales bacterium]|nr:histidine phosphatase family protein [Clostridiales bacterium]
MLLLIIRHGESEADILKVHEGRADFSLTARGHKQALEMASYVKEHYAITKLYSSTLKRAKQTARYLSDLFNIGIEFEEDLMEFNNGLLAGLSFEEAKEKYPLIKNLPIDQAVYGQESKLEFRNRADRVLKKIISEGKEDDTIAIVSHGGMINQLYRSFLKLPVQEDAFFITGDTGIHVWKIGVGINYIIKSNISEHIIGI